MFRFAQLPKGIKHKGGGKSRRPILPLHGSGTVFDFDPHFIPRRFTDHPFYIQGIVEIGEPELFHRCFFSPFTVLLLKIFRCRIPPSWFPKYFWQIAGFYSGRRSFVSQGVWGSPSLGAMDIIALCLHAVSPKAKRWKFCFCGSALISCGNRKTSDLRNSPRVSRQSLPSP